MSHPIEIKSIGFLIDEYITANFKVDVNTDGARQRMADLESAIDARLPATEWLADNDVLELYDVLRWCWDAQDAIMGDNTDFNVVDAARLAQKANAQRNVLIRKLDEKFGDRERSPLGKTYA